MKAAGEEADCAHARFDQTRAAYEAAVEQRLKAAAREFGLFSMAPDELAAVIQRLGVESSAIRDPAVGDETNSGARTIRVLVKAGHNLGIEKRSSVARAGLAWNGRSGQWIGKCSTEHLEALRIVFGGGKIEVFEESPTDGRSPTSEATVVSAASTYSDKPGSATEASAASTVSPSALPTASNSVENDDPHTVDALSRADESTSTNGEQAIEEDPQSDRANDREAEGRTPLRSTIRRPLRPGTAR
jgi:hypothetical protein